MQNGSIVTTTNHAGGILGGITSGMPLIARIAVKPTPSIAREQQTVSLSGGGDAVLAVRGRHDPCIVPRAVPVAEAVTAAVLLDMILD
jgi:chorismate synthase